jgi:ABC-type transport system involved in multi-copper enzyme maturation permease subunit
VNQLIAAELMKFRTRWLPYVLLFIAMAGISFQIWVGGYVTFQASEEFASQQDALNTLSLPWSLPAMLEAGQYWGAILVGVLIASVVSTEFNWGTVRQPLIRGHSRAEYLTAKLLGLALASAVGLLVALACGLLMSVLATLAAGESVTLDAAGGPSVAEMLLMVLRAGYCVLPYALVAFTVSVVTRSTAAGTVAVILYVFIESAAIGILGAAGGHWADARAYLLGHNVAALLTANHIGDTGFNSLAFRGMHDPSELPSPVVGAFVVAVYSVVLAGLAYWSFGRRDVRASEGS